jgi:hypothetical protein
MPWPLLSALEVLLCVKLRLSKHPAPLAIKQWRESLARHGATKLLEIGTLDVGAGASIGGVTQQNSP